MNAKPQQIADEENPIVGAIYCPRWNRKKPRCEDDCPLCEGFSAVGVRRDGTYAPRSEEYGAKGEE